MRIAFMGTPNFAVPTLDALVVEGHDVIAVYSQPPRPAGRGKGLRKGAVHVRADELGIEVRTPLTLRDPAEQAEFAELELDAAVVAAYGLILPPAVLDAPRLGCLNVHASLLPRWRGAAPVQRAILAGDAVTGVTIMQMDRGLDTGAMLATVRTDIDGKTAGALTDELAHIGARLLLDTLAATPPPVPQPDGATYAAKLDKSEARLDFNQSAEQVERQIRAFHPSAFFEVAGERIRILAAQPHPGQGWDPATVIDEALTISCAEGTISPTLVQRAGKSAMAPAELLRGFAIPAGTILA